uniref:CSON003586 protein n=1 Tax=Culicoides sonorensis TaxID=179676 RepID=A0A336MQH7_CULSO
MKIPEMKINPAPVSLVDAGYITSSCSLVSCIIPFEAPSITTKPKRGAKTSKKGDTRASREVRKMKNFNNNHDFVESLPNCAFRCHLNSAKDERHRISYP